MKRFLLTLLLALSLGIGAAWAVDDPVYTVEFNKNTFNKYTNSYETEITVTTNGKQWAVNGFNNGTTNTAWSEIRAGRKNAVSTASIEAKFAMPEAISKIVVSINAFASGRLEAVYVQTSTSASFSATSTKIDTSLPTGIGDFSINIPNPQPNLYYKLVFEFNGTEKSSNGYFRINGLKYFAAPSDPETVTPIFSDLTVNYDEVVTPIVTEPADFFAKAGNVTYTMSLNEPVVEGKEVLMIDGSYIFASCAGQATVTASWGDTDYYYAGSATFNVTVNALKPTLSYSAATCEVVLEEEQYEFPVLTADNKGLKVVYSSSDENVAMIDEKTGELELMGEGTTTITAKIEAVAGQNEGAEASYELTVKPAGALASPVFSVESGEVVYGTEVSISAAKGDIYYGTSVESAVKYEAPFTLNTIGEVTYVAYAKTANGQSETVSVTYNVVPAKAAFEFKTAAGETMMGNLLDINALLNNPEGLNYTLSTDNAEVARVALNAPKRIWLMGVGNVSITATPEATETFTAEATTYTLTVKEEVGEMEEAETIFDFTKEGAYGMVAQTGNSSIYAEGDAQSIEFYEGDLKITTAKNGGTGTRLWTGDKKYEYRINRKSSITISVPEDCYIVSVSFTKGTVATKPSFNCEEISSGLVWTATGNQTKKATFTTIDAKSNRMDISTITVKYMKPGQPAHCHANLAFDGYREALVDNFTVAEPAIMSPDATAAVEYIVLDGEGNATEEVGVETDDDGSIIIAAYTKEEAEYTLVAYIDPYNEANGKYYPAVVETPLYVREVIMPAELYLHGHFFNRYYDLTAPVKMEKKGRDFVATDILIGGNPEHAGDAYDYVFTTHKLDRVAAESSMMRAAAAAGSHQWDVLTEGTVYHNEIDGALTATAASDVTSAADITPINAGKEGLYQITVNFDDPKTPTYKAVFTDITTGIEGVTVDNNAEAVYYDLTGRRVANPSAGVFIRVQGGKAEKIMIK